MNINSPAAFVAWPGATGYVAARWAMRGFHEALRADLARTGIGTSLVVPGEVASNYFRNNSGAEARMPKLARLYRTLNVEEVARAIVAAVEDERARMLLPRLLRLSMFVHRLWPWPAEVLTRRTGMRLHVAARDPRGDGDDG